jgi:YHS domain-containing protein
MADIASDPVCGMQVDTAQATEKGLTADHDGETYYFCGKGCMLDFKEDPGPYFAPDYKPSM